MSDRVDISGLSVDRGLYDLVEEISLGTGIETPAFWQSMVEIIAELGAQNQSLLEKRDQLQTQIDAWHKANPGAAQLDQYKAFLQEIGYLVPESAAFQVTTEGNRRSAAGGAGGQCALRA